MLSDVIHTVGNWPWATIAAFTAAGAAVSVARAENKERATRLGQESVVEINTRALDYHRDVLKFFQLIRDNLNGSITAGELNEKAYPHLTETVAAMDRHLKFARMACNDFAMQIRIAEAESHIYALLEVVDRPAKANETAHETQDRLGLLIEDGLTTLKGFSTATEGFVSRGFELYSPRRGLRYRLAQKRWDYSVAKARRRRIDPPQASP